MRLPIGLEGEVANMRAKLLSRPNTGEGGVDERAFKCRLRVRFRVSFTVNRWRRMWSLRGGFQSAMRGTGSIAALYRGVTGKG